MSADQLARVLQNPLVALFVALVLGALAVSGRLSQFAANLILLAALMVALVAIVGSNLPDLRLKAGLACVVVGICLGISYWVAPTWRVGHILRATRSVDITWNFDHPDKGRVFFLGLSGGGGRESRVLSFQATGRNNLDEPIRHVQGVVRSDLTNTELPIFFVVDGARVRPEDTNGIPRGAEFVVASAPLQSTTSPREGEQAEGIPVSRFLTELGQFMFVREQIVAFEQVTSPERPLSVTKKPPQTPSHR